MSTRKVSRLLASARAVQFITRDFVPPTLDDRSFFLHPTRSKFCPPNNTESDQSRYWSSEDEAHCHKWLAAHGELVESFGGVQQSDSLVLGFEPIEPDKPRTHFQGFLVSMCRTPASETLDSLHSINWYMMFNCTSGWTRLA